MTAFKVLTAEQWAQFDKDGEFLGAPVDVADGYIHLSTQDQLQVTLDKHFEEHTGLIVVKIDLTSYGEALRWEESRGGALFPHIYARLRRDTVLAVERLD